MKKIWPWLLLLLLLIIFCVWSKKDRIHVTTATPAQVALTPTISVEKHYMDYTITQKESAYALDGSFSSTQQQTSLSDTYVANSSHLTMNHISIDATLLGEEAVTLTNKILPHFIKHYKNGKIVYSNNTLRVYGDVTNYEAKHKMQNLLNTSTLSTQNNTNVIKEKPIHFSITKTLEKVDLVGTFNTQAQGETLRSKLPASTTTHINQAANLIDNGAITFTESILPEFIKKYKNGKIEYKDEVLNISGMVDTQEALDAMNQILTSDTFTIVNNTTVDQEALAKAAAEAEATRKAEEAKQANIAAEAETKRLAEEKKQAEEKAKLEKEKKFSQTLVAKKEVKEKITKLLQVENIEFKVAKGSLTPKGILTVDKLATILSKYPHIKAEIAGHTDSDGSAIFNQKLSQKRVDTVRARLIEKGIDAKRLTARGYGESKPLVPNTSDENKQKNRRVEINIQGE